MLNRLVVESQLTKRIKDLQESAYVGEIVDLRAVYRRFGIGFLHLTPREREEIEVHEARIRGFKETSLVIADGGIGRRVTAETAKGLREERESNWHEMLELKANFIPNPDKIPELDDCLILPALGESSMLLSWQIANRSGIRVADLRWKEFPDGELRPDLHESVHGKHVFIVTRYGRDIHTEMLSQFLNVSLSKTHCASKITVLDPGPLYDRSDITKSEAKDKSNKVYKVRHPSGFRMRLDILSDLGVTGYISIDPHPPKADQMTPNKNFNYTIIQGAPLFAPQIAKDYPGKKIVLFCLDRGQNTRIREDGILSTLNRQLGYEIEVVVCDKRKTQDKVDYLKIVEGGKYIRPGKLIVALDDIISSGDSMIKGAEAAFKAGCETFIAAATHPVLSHDAVDRMYNWRSSKTKGGRISGVYTLDTRVLPSSKKGFLKVFKSSEILAVVARAVALTRASSVSGAVNELYGIGVHNPKPN